MADTFTTRTGLRKPANNAASWDTLLNADLDVLDAQEAIGALAVANTAVPSASLNVKVAAGTYRKADGGVGTYAGTASQACTTAATNYVYLTDAGTLTVNTTGFPTGNVVPLAVVVAGATTITSIADARRPFGSFGTARQTIFGDTDGTTITFDCAAYDKHTVTLGGNRTLAVTGDTDGQELTIILKQDGTGTRTVTWWSGIKWHNSTTPTLTATLNKADAFRILRTGSGAYYGFILGQNL